MSVKMIAATAGILESPRDLERAHLGRLRPAFDRDLAVARVKPHRNTTGELFRRALHKLGVAHRRGADDDARNAFRQPRLDGFQVANATAKLHRHGDRLQHRLDGVHVHRLAGKGAVKGRPRADTQSPALRRRGPAPPGRG